jgi:hypothetical protein
MVICLGALFRGGSALTNQSQDVGGFFFSSASCCSIGRGPIATYTNPMLLDTGGPKSAPMTPKFPGGIFDEYAINPTSTSALSNARAGAMAGLSRRIKRAYTEIPSRISVGDKWDSFSSVSFGSQPAFFKRYFSSRVILSASESCADCSLTSVPEYGLIDARKVISERGGGIRLLRPEGAKTRGAIILSSTRLSHLKAMILDCCASLIPSSNPNNNSVQAASIATPPTTNTLASENFGFSRTIPAATAKLAAIASVKSTAWGQPGSNEPEKNLLTFLYFFAHKYKEHNREQLELPSTRDDDPICRHSYQPNLKLLAVKDDAVTPVKVTLSPAWSVITVFDPDCTISPALNMAE